MIGERDHLYAAFGGRLRHLEHAQLAIAPVRVGLQIRADILEFDQLRKFFRLRSLDLAVVLTDLGRDPFEREGFVDFLFGGR
jgi:hypothetical protein